MSAKPMAILKENLFANNPILVQVLGICSTLAVTNSVRNTLVMTAGVSVATALSSLTLSAMKDLIPGKIRMMVQVLVISFYVILFDILLRAWLPDASRQLGPYVGLIITNCIIMGRAEAFARANGPLLSLWDGFTSGLGYMGVLLAISLVREPLGFGTVLGFRIVPEGFVPWTIMIMAPSAFFLVAIFLWLVSIARERKKRRAAAAKTAPAGLAPGARA